MWFKLERSLFKTDEDIYFGAVYVPPADSRFKTADETDIFEIEIIHACVFNKYLFLMGTLTQELARPKIILMLVIFLETVLRSTSI